VTLRNKIRTLAFQESMDKWAQGLSDTMADIAKPVLFGLGGYGASRALGGEKATGVPDWLLGPAVGLGAAMPAASAISRGIRNRQARKTMESGDSEQQAQLEELLRREQEQQEMYAPTQQMIQQMTAYQMGMPPEMMRTASDKTAGTSFRVPADQAETIMTQAQQRVTQQQQQQQQQQIAQATVAQQIKAQFRGLQQARSKQVAKKHGG
jgi:hypothetical protein